MDPDKEAEVWRWLENNGITEEEIERLQTQKKRMSTRISALSVMFLTTLISITEALINSDVPMSELPSQSKEIHEHLRTLVNLNERIFASAYEDAMKGA